MAKKGKKDGKSKSKKLSRGRHSQFFLYLPAKGGQRWIDRVRLASKEDGCHPSTFIRQWLNPMMGSTKWRAEVSEAAKVQGISITKLIRRATREYIANLGK